MGQQLSARSPWQVTRSVWHALFLREALARITGDRFGWFWMLAEPAAMVGVMAGLRAFVMGGNHIAGAHFVPWVITGLFGFYLFRENMMRSIGAIEANRALFAYRQVKPIDPVLVRCFLEGMIKTFLFVLFLFAGILLELELVPVDPLSAMWNWISLWLLGLGAGLVLSALSSMVSEIAPIMRIITMPLMIISGAFLPLNFLPHDLQFFLLLNPIVHGLEYFRASFFTEYRPIGGISELYLWGWILGSIGLGLSLHLRFDQKLKAQ